MEFAVVGMGISGGLPSWIQDMRSTAPDEMTERDWCRQYARSHLVIGVHGSNMMLPSAHAAAVLTLMPAAGQLYLAFTDTILNGPYSGHPTMSSLLRYRMLPLQTPPEVVAEWAAAMVQSFPVVSNIWQSPGDRTESRNLTDSIPAGTTEQTAVHSGFEPPGEMPNGFVAGVNEVHRQR